MIHKKKEPAVTSSGRNLPTRDVSSDLSAASQTPQQIVDRLRRLLEQIDRLPLPVGQPGCYLLDALDLSAKIRERIRDKARDVLEERPGAIPHWHVDVQSRRTLSRDAEAVYEALASVIPDLTPAEFLRYCSSSISALNRLLEAEEGIDLAVKDALGELLSRETVVSLRRDKEGQ